jgi:hypothetical protein
VLSSASEKPAGGTVLRNKSGDGPETSFKKEIVMTKKIRSLLAWSLLAGAGLVFLSRAASPCTVAIVSAKAAKNGRILMWKNRDTSELDNTLIHLSGPRYGFTAVIDASDPKGKEVWAGLNTAGFAIMNSAASDLAGPARKMNGDGNGAFMKLALGECATVRQFEELLVREKGRFDLAADFGVIDAEGNACFFETAMSSFQKFDSRDPRIAPFGTIVRTNFAFTSPDLLNGGGFIRFDRISHIIEAARAANKIDVRFILQEAARDLVQEKLRSYPLTRSLPEDPAEPLFVNTNDTINRNSTASAIVFEGAPSPDKAHLATMWVILGQPCAGVAVPVWPAAGKVPAPTAGPGTAPLCDFARALAAYLYPDRRGHMSQYLSVSRLRTYGGEGVPAKLLRVENEVIARTAAKLAEWEKKRPAAADMAEFQESAAVFAYEALKRAFPDIR